MEGKVREEPENQQKRGGVQPLKGERANAILASVVLQRNPCQLPEAEEG